MGITLDLYSGIIEFVLQVGMNALAILPSAFLCFYALGKDGLKYRISRITVTTLAALLLYSIVYFWAWYHWLTPAYIAQMLFVMAAFVYLLHVSKKSRLETAIIYIVAIFYASINSSLFDIAADIMPYMPDSELWYLSDFITMLVIVALTMPLAIWFVKAKLNPALLGVSAASSKALLILPIIFIALLAQHIFLDNMDWFLHLVYLCLLSTALAMLMQILIMMRTATENMRQKQTLSLMKEQMLSQAKRYEEMAEHNQEIKALHHDMRHHLQLLEHMIKERRFDEAALYLKEYSQQLPSFEQPLCDCYVVDIIANHYKQQADDLGIAATFSLLIPDESGFADMDLCIVLGNLLENAINAAEKQQQGKSFIQVLVKLENEELRIAVDNSCLDDMEEEVAPGVGLSSVQAIAEKYGGIAMFEKKDGRFLASVLMYANQSAKEEPA